MNELKLLKRERVNHILSEVYNYSLTIIEAPMGFGKTTAVKTFLEADGNPYLWITFLNSSESHDFMWKEFSEKISSKLDKEAGKKLKSLGFPRDVPQTSKILSILNNIVYEDKTVFVIDDYHLSKEINLFKLIEKVILEKIDNLHIIIITRDTTNINFTELVSKGMCKVISQQQLKFTKEELRSYCLMMDKNIAEHDLAKINAYADGWISLTYMMLLGLRNGIPIGMNSTVDELVENTLFNTYSRRIQNFLFKLSFMDDFSVKQAEFVTKEEQAEKILKKLRRENAFVFYDDQTQKYKIHNVLLDFLRIKQNFKGKELKAIYRRLGEWYLKKDAITAYGYFNRAGDVERILSEFNNPANITNELTEFEGTFEMFESTSCELLYKYPIAYLQHIFRSILKGNEEIRADALNKLDKLKIFYENIENIDLNYRNRIIAEILVVKKFTKFNYIEEMGMYNERIMELLKGKSSYLLLRNNEFTFGSPHLLYIYFRDKGTFKKVFCFAKDKMSIHSKISDGCGTGCEYAATAEYALETGETEAAELNSLKAIYKAKTKAQVGIITCAYFNLIRLYIFQGKADKAIEKLKELGRLIEEENSSVYNTTFDLCKGYVYACLIQQNKIPYWLQMGDMSEAHFMYQGMAFNYIVYGKAVMLSKNYIKLEMLTESFAEYFSIFKNQLGFIHNDIFKAVAKYNLYGMEEGVSALEAALNEARDDYIVMPFAENAQHIIDMLRIIENKNLKDEYIKKVLAYSNLYNENLNNSNFEKLNLSQKETEVLSLIAEGLKRRETATRLSISEGTVRTHLQHIYQKLGVSGKVEAIKIAKMHNII